jgi:hypothetical protein
MLVLVGPLVFHEGSQHTALDAVEASLGWNVVVVSVLSLCSFYCVGHLLLLERFKTGQ